METKISRKWVLLVTMLIFAFHFAHGQNEVLTASLKPAESIKKKLKKLRMILKRKKNRNSLTPDILIPTTLATSIVLLPEAT